MLKALALHTEARTSFSTCASSFPTLSNPTSLIERIFPLLLLVVSFHFFDPKKKNENETQITLQIVSGLTDIGCRICSSTNTSRCASSNKRRTSKRRRCASRPRHCGRIRGLSGRVMAQILHARLPYCSTVPHVCDLMRSSEKICRKSARDLALLMRHQPVTVYLTLSLAGLMMQKNIIYLTEIDQKMS